MRRTSVLLLLAAAAMAEDRQAGVTAEQRLELQKLYSKAAISQLNAERAKGAYLARVEEMRKACVSAGGEFTLQDDGDVRCEVKQEKK